MYLKEFQRFEASDNPLIYTPGDNEWTDCHRPPNFPEDPAEADPLNRLSLVRETFFADGYSLGEKEIPVQRQSVEYPENARWIRGVTFATLHVVGSTTTPPGCRANYRQRGRVPGPQRRKPGVDGRDFRRGEC